MKKDFYQVLGIDRSSLGHLSGSQITRIVNSRFRTQAKKYHPDCVGEIEGNGAGAKIARLSEARDTLKDPIKRAAYDRQLEMELSYHQTPVSGR